MKNHWLLLVPNKRMWWKSQRLGERKRDSEGGAEECKTRPHPSHELRRDIPVPLARGYIHSKSQKRGNLGEAGRGTHQYTTSPLGSLCAQTQCPFQSNSIPSISMTNVHFAADEYVHTRNNKTRKNKISAWMLIVKILHSPSFPLSLSLLLFPCPPVIGVREMWAVVVGYLWLAELVGILGWREQVMAFWRALIYTPPFLSLSSVKRWERWGAASSHSCELHLPGVRGSIVNSDLVPSTMPNYYQHHVIYTSVVEENITLQAATGQSCAAAERGDLLNWPLKIHDECTFNVDLANLLLSSRNVKCRLYLSHWTTSKYPAVMIDRN